MSLRNEEGTLTSFYAGDTPPAWAQARITNPSAWEVAPEQEATPAPAAPPAPAEDEPEATPAFEQEADSQEEAAPAPDDEPVDESAQADSSADEDLLGAPAVPAKRGAGSGRAAWMEYAKYRGLQLPEDASRDAIIEAVENLSE